MSKYIYIIYKTTNLVNKKFYIGKHRQISEDFDGYLGSGKLIKEAIKKYGRENFVRETIAIFTDETECYNAETDIVGELWKYRNACYNLAPGGNCGMSARKQIWWDQNPEKKQERAQDWINNNPSRTSIGRKRIQESNKRRVWSDESKEKCGAAHRGKPKPRKVCPHCSRSIAINLFDRYHNENCKEKINE